ncbi:hypothetical protein PVAG01_08157 [Phlyctema vagabunda]|uniref:DUF7708 domain-containing protein n=1 Tax=Phlyctema vagabunda TaxID=108571 RepID=A0ABR4P8M9_9HELO
MTAERSENDDTSVDDVLIKSWFFPAASLDHLDPVKDAYTEAVSYFKSALTNDECKVVWIDNLTSIGDVQEAALQAERLYQSSKNGKARLWLSKFSSRVMYYGAIMDTLSQHHPEYVSLVWGAMKFVFVGVINQEQLITELSKALSIIADALPRVQLHSILYPTEKMKRAIAMLYARIIQFVKRAMHWYKEGRMKHIYNAIIRPYDLRFKDLVEEIREYSSKVDQIASASAQAEMRIMHRSQVATQTSVHNLENVLSQWLVKNGILERLNEMMKEQKMTKAAISDVESRILRRLEEYQGINSSRYIDTNRKLCDLQYCQVLSLIANTSLPTPDDSLSYCQSIQKHRRRYTSGGQDITRIRQRLQSWSSAKGSSLVHIKGTPTTKHATKDMLTDMVTSARGSNRAVIWALASRPVACQRTPTSIDVLKYLALQVLQCNNHLMNERSLSVNASAFDVARTEAEWFSLLESIMIGISQLFIIIDAELFGGFDSGTGTWAEEFSQLFEKLRSGHTVLKVALATYRKTLRLSPSEAVDTVFVGSKRNDRVNVRGKGKGLLYQSTSASKFSFYK